MNLKLLRGKMIRVTKLDGCGKPLLGPDSVVTSEGFITLGLTANTFQATAVTQDLANGKQCINDTPAPTFVNWTIALTMCGVDPNIISLMTGNPLVYNDAATPEAYGIDIESNIDVDASGFAIEVWSGTPSDECSDDGEVTYGYAIVPFVKGGIIGDQSWENGAINAQVTGAQSKDGSQWGVGPFDVELDNAGDPSPLLSPLSTKNHERIIPTNLAPPVAAEGATALGVQAATATQVAGTKATLSPTNSYAPLNLAEALAWPLAASPTTAWTTGSYVLMRDGSKIHRSATTWVAGPA